MSNKSFVFTAQRNTLKSGAVSMNAVDWKTMFGGIEGDELTEHAAYQAVAWVLRCVQIRCNALSAIPVHVYQGAEPPDPEDETPPVEVQWEFADSLPDTLWMSEASAQLYGGAYWLREQNFVKDKGYRWLLPSTIRPIYSPERGLEYFERRVKQKVQRLEPVKDVLYYWTPCLDAEVGPGKGWVSTVLTEAGMARAQNEFAKAFFSRGAIPAVLLSIEGNPAKEELDRLEAWWKRLLQGVKRAFETVAVRASVKPQILSYPTKDLAMPELATLVRQQICVAAGVPQTMLEDAANYATAAEHHQTFYTETIVPEAVRIQAWLNKQLFGPIGLRLVLDWQSLDIFQADEAERSSALQAMVNAGIPVDMAMEMLGMDLPNDMTYDEFRARLEDEKEKSFERQQQLAATRGPQPGQPDPGERRGELRRWQRKALKALANGKGAAVEFESDVLGDEESETIAARLAGAHTEEEVKAAFQPPFCESPYP